jgi:uncharacterized membrane protein YdjX (TVP38/TMEM64 family)
MSSKPSNHSNTLTNNPPAGLTISRIASLLVATLITAAIILLSSHIKELQALGYAGAFLIMLIGNATVIFPVPGVIFVIAMGSTLNPWLLGLCAGPGAALGELTGYLAGYGGAAPLQHTKLYRRFDYWMEHSGPWAILLLSIIPNPVFDMAGVLAGASKMKLWQFLLSAWVGKTIQAIGLAWAGALSLDWVIKLFS